LWPNNDYNLELAIFTGTKLQRRKGYRNILFYPLGEFCFKILAFATLCFWTFVPDKELPLLGKIKI